MTNELRYEVWYRLERTGGEKKIAGFTHRIDAEAYVSGLADNDSYYIIDTCEPEFEYELVVVWASGDNEIYDCVTEEDAEEAGKRMEMALGNQISWWGTRKKLYRVKISDDKGRHDTLVFESKEGAEGFANRVNTDNDEYAGCTAVCLRNFAFGSARY